MKRTYTFRYLTYGALFGFFFPVFSTFLDLYIKDFAVTFENVLRVQWSNPMHLVIDTAPLFLGLFAGFAGRRQDRISQINESLQKEIDTREQTVEQLRIFQEDLERQVEERTSDLSRRKTQLETAAKVAKQATGIRDLDTLLNEAVALISDQFGFYHAGIFLIDNSEENAVLEAASSTGGQRMLARDHKLRVGQEGIVGYAAGTGEPRIALDVGADAVYFDNPDMPTTRSEMAIPLKVREQVIGILDVQSTEENAFSEEDVEILQVLGDQIALAIETANLISENQGTLDALRRSVYEQTREVWSKKVRNKYDLGYICTNRKKVHAIDKKSGLIEQTIQVEDGVLAIPIRVRDHVIGIVNLRKEDSSQVWTEEEQTLMESLTDQIGVALESARLYMDTRRRAERERLVAEITTKIRASNDPKLILRTAINELQTALQANKAHFHFKSLQIASEEAAVEGS